MDYKQSFCKLNSQQTKLYNTERVHGATVHKKMSGWDGVEYGVQPEDPWILIAIGAVFSTPIIIWIAVYVANTCDPSMTKEEKRAFFWASFGTLLVVIITGIYLWYRWAYDLKVRRQARRIYLASIPRQWDRGSRGGPRM